MRAAVASGRTRLNHARGACCVASSFRAGVLNDRGSLLKVRKEDIVKKQQKPQNKRFNIRKLEQRIAPGQSHFPPGQFPAGNPAHAPGNSNSPSGK